MHVRTLLFPAGLVALLAGCSGPSPSADGGPDTGVSTFDAGPPQPCESPGTVENVPCGSCGTVQRFCTAERVWAYGACESEGECTPGTLDTITCGNCGEQMARCTTECTWMATGECTGEGMCTPGTRLRNGEGCPAGSQRDVLCSDACMFEPAGECTSDACTVPGTLEDSPCGGMCGTSERFCTAELIWEYGPCLNEGVCVAGSTDTVDCGNCGTQASRCTDACQWAATGACMDEGECAPGELGRTSDGCSPGQTRDVRCDDACAFTIDAGMCSESRPVDVTILIDVTGSNAVGVSLLSTVRTRLITPLLALTGVNVGVSFSGDFPIAGYGGTGDNPFEGGIEPTTSVTAIDAELAGLAAMGGGDGPDAGIEALSVLSGGPVDPTSIALSCSAGRIAGGCWRSGAAQVIVVYSDGSFHNGPDPASDMLFSPYTGITPAPATWPDVSARLNTANATLFVVDTAGSSGTGILQYNEMLTDLGQPTTDRFDGTSTFLGASCDAIVTRVQTLAGL